MRCNGYLLAGVFCLLLVSILAACGVPIPGRTLLTTPHSMDAGSPVVAVHFSGTRHFAWTEMHTVLNRQGIYYQRVLPGGTTYQTFLYSMVDDADYGNPDLVVADNGAAYLAFTSCTASGCSAKYSYFSADWHGTPSLPLDAGVGPQDLMLVQGGSIVYALGVTMGPTSSMIKYKKLSGYLREGIVYSDSGWFHVSPSAAVDSGGDLHVAFRSSFAFGAAYKVSYTNNDGSDGDMALPLYQEPVNAPSSPSLSIAGGNGDIFIAYAVPADPSDSLYVWHPDPGASPTSLLLGPATAWQMRGNPVLVASNNGGYTVIFSASNSASADTEIWTYSSGGSVPNQVTNNEVDDGQPVAAKAKNDTIESPVFAWRVARPNPGGGTCLGDVMAISEVFPHLRVRTVFRDQGTCLNLGYDLAANEDRGLGVWLDVRPGSSILEPWYAVDGSEVFLPAIRR
jgi:hypothetical protein